MDFHMLHQQGLSIRKIAALRGVSRNAVRRALRSSSPPTGKRRREKGCKLKAFEPLRAVIEKGPGAVIKAPPPDRRILHPEAPFPPAAARVAGGP
jgi:transposase